MCRLPSDGLVVRQQSDVLGFLCSAQNDYPPPWWGPQSPQKNSKVFVSSWRKNWDPVPRLHYCFLSAPPLKHSPPSRISNCLNMPFGALGRSGSWKNLFPTNKKWEKVMWVLRAPQGPARFMTMTLAPLRLCLSFMHLFSPWEHSAVACCPLICITFILSSHAWAL